MRACPKDETRHGHALTTLTRTQCGNIDLRVGFKEKDKTTCLDMRRLNCDLEVSKRTVEENRRPLDKGGE